MPSNKFAIAATEAAFNLQGAVEAMKKFKKLPRPDTLIMHPATYAKVKKAMGVPEQYDLLLDVVLDDLVPQNDMTTRWVPPAAGQFTELTAEDEAWARPLGLGRVESVNLGPLIYKMKGQLSDWLNEEMLKPMPIPGMFTSHVSPLAELPSTRFSMSHLA